ncbi:hypothetical protein CPC08DRAFT_758962 [Agrocybe pediades]|nr:hypothetical protein CPC08DRAFT_758962 [Agrocybe pediades]
MGNSSSSGRGHHDESVDYGSLVPQGVYTGPRDWNQAVVSQLIVARRLAPFYRPLEDYDDSWDDDQILAARKELPDPEAADVVTRIEATATANSKSKRPSSLKEPSKPEAQVYRGAVECPICFLYYPPNINHSRCCDQAICTECFVQIKRAEPTTTHLSSEPAACPYCVQDNFGVVYKPPPWRAGLGSEGSNGIWSDSSKSSEPTTRPTHKRRQKSFGADSPEVVTTDQIRPDWEAKLEAVRAAVARRANRRIIMRQVGDRLIPVGVTSGRVHALSPEEAAAAGATEGGSRRSRRRQGGQNGAYEQFMGMAGQDLEELMLMEAMRLSLLDHEEHQRKEAEEKKKREAEAAAAAGVSLPSEGGPDSQGTASGPSTSGNSDSLRVSTDHSSSTSSTQRSPSPSSSKQSNVNSHESLGTGRRSWSLSRSRTPPATDSPATIPPSQEGQASWHNRSTSPPAFSTLRAALTTTSTAAAILSSSMPATSDPPTAQESLPSSSVTPPLESATSIPSITVQDNDTRPGRLTPVAGAPPSSTENASTLPSDPELSSQSGTSPNAVDLARTISPESSITSLESDSESGAGIGLTSYGHLASSPESTLSHEPLLYSSGPAANVDASPTKDRTSAATHTLEEVSR